MFLFLFFFFFAESTNQIEQPSASPAMNLCNTGFPPQLPRPANLLKLPSLRDGALSYHHLGKTISLLLGAADQGVSKTKSGNDKPALDSYSATVFQHWDSLFVADIGSLCLDGLLPTYGI
jgi:hypothetical protein